MALVLIAPTLLNLLVVAEARWYYARRSEGVPYKIPRYRMLFRHETAQISRVTMHTPTRQPTQPLPAFQRCCAAETAETAAVSDLFWDTRSKV